MTRIDGFSTHDAAAGIGRRNCDFFNIVTMKKRTFYCEVNTTCYPLVAGTVETAAVIPLSKILGL
jgi:hypothetical protein